MALPSNVGYKGCRQLVNFTTRDCLTNTGVVLREECDGTASYAGQQGLIHVIEDAVDCQLFQVCITFPL
jgi:hypothetical protein